MAEMHLISQIKFTSTQCLTPFIAFTESSDYGKCDKHGLLVILTGTVAKGLALEYKQNYDLSLVFSVSGQECFNNSVKILTSIV